MYKTIHLTFLLLPLLLCAQSHAPKWEWYDFPFALDEYRPHFEIWHNQTVHRARPGYSRLELSNFDREKELSIRISPRESSRKFIKGYTLYGLTLDRNYEYVSEKTIMVDSAFKVTFDEEYILSLDGSLFNEGGVGGRYTVSFDSLVAFGEDGVAHTLKNNRRSQFSYFFEILVEQDPFVLEHGFPTMTFLVNGKPKGKDQIVRKSDKLSLVLSYPDSVELEGSRFMISSFKLGEYGCFGDNLRNVIEEESLFPLSLPNEEIEIGPDRHFAIKLGEMYRIDADGQRHRIYLSFNQRTRHYWRERKSYPRR